MTGTSSADQARNFARHQASQPFTAPPRTGGRRSSPRSSTRDNKFTNAAPRPADSSAG